MSSQTAKKTASKPSSAKTASMKKPTVAGLAAELKALEARLKKTDTQNSTALESLDGMVSDLTKSAKTSKTSQKAALTRGLNALEKKLKSHFETANQEVRADIRTELARVTTRGAGLETLEQALIAAHDKLDAHDITQREAVAKLNHHIANLAAAVDARLSAETQARKTDSADLAAKLSHAESRIGQRIDRVEDDTANALNRIGDKVAEFAAVLDDRSRQSDAQTAERLADLAQETQADFNHAQTDVSTRLEALETIAAEWSPASAKAYAPANNDDPRVDRMSETLSQLQEEISRLHARLASVQTETQSNVVPMAKAPALAAPRPTLRDDNPYAAAYAAPAATQDAMQNYDAHPAEPRESHMPVEFNPEAYAAPAADPYPAQPYNHKTNSHDSQPDYQKQDYAPAPPPVPQMPPLLPPMASVGGLSAQTSQMGEPLTAPMPGATYDNPAYADSDEMRAERVGVETSRRASLPSLGKLPISGQNLRVGVLAVGVAVVGLFAAKTILGGEPAPNPVARLETNAPAPDRGSSDSASPFGAAVMDVSGDRSDLDAIAPIAPLGTYEETATPIIAAGAQDTLTAAVTAGNPIAQFQMGLSKLQSGDTEEAARLIRLAANRNQPAAQYRLAKLYESGTGVAKDPITARELVERAAIGGNRIAMHDLGNYHFYGQGGLERDPAIALDWFTKAAERGVVDSQFNVAFLREGGQGIPEDTSVAYFWYNIAARQGDQGAPGRVAALGAKLDDATRTKIEADAARFTPKPVDEAANGLFRDVPWAAKSAKVNESANSKAREARITRVRTAQTLLTDLGFDIGGADGAAGPKTRAAVREFQKVNGLPETGEISDDLLDRLEIAAGV